MGTDSGGGEAERISYLPSKRRRVFGGCFVLGAGLVGLGGFALSAGIAWLFRDLASTAPELRPWLLGGPAIFLAATVLLVGVGIAVTRSGRGQAIHLTPTELVHVRGERADQRTVLQLTSVARVGMYYQPSPTRRGAGDIDTGHYVARIEERGGAYVDLDVGYGSGYLTTFDVRPILQGLLPLLPPTAEVDPRLRALAEEGRCGFVKAALG